MNGAERYPSRGTHLAIALAAVHVERRRPQQRAPAGVIATCLERWTFGTESPYYRFFYRQIVNGHFEFQMSMIPRFHAFN